MFMQVVFFLVVVGFLGTKAYKLHVQNKYLTKHLRNKL
jgi:hypothetical protein